MTAHLTVPQVAERWRCSPRYIWSLTASGALPTLRLGRLVRLRLSDVEAYETAHLDGAAPPAPATRPRRRARR